jgi:hypothetical protein
MVSGTKTALRVLHISLSEVARTHVISCSEESFRIAPGATRHIEYLGARGKILCDEPHSDGKLKGVRVEPELFLCYNVVVVLPDSILLLRTGLHRIPPDIPVG